MYQNIVYCVVVGSHAHGVPTLNSDKNIRFVYTHGKKRTTTKEQHIGWIQNHFLRLLLNSDVNAVEMMFVPDDCVLEQNSLFESIRQHKHLLLSRQTYINYRMYAKLLLRRACKNEGFDYISAAHSYRMIESCRAILNGTYTSTLVTNRFNFIGIKFKNYDSESIIEGLRSELQLLKGTFKQILPLYNTLPVDVQLK